MQFPITIGLHRSRFLDAGFFLVLISAAIVFGVWPQGAAVPLIALPSVALAGLLAWRQLRPALSAIRLEGNGSMSVLARGDAEFVAAEALPGAVVHPWLCVVRLKLPDGRVVSLNATVGTLKTEDFRRLRVFMRWRAQFSRPADVA